MLSQVTGLLSLKPVVTGPLLAQLLLVIVPQHKEPFSLVLKKTTTVLKLSFKKRNNKHRSDLGNKIHASSLAFQWKACVFTLIAGAWGGRKREEKTPAGYNVSLSNRRVWASGTCRGYICEPHLHTTCPTCTNGHPRENHKGKISNKLTWQRWLWWLALMRPPLIMRKQ